MGLTENLAVAYHSFFSVNLNEFLVRLFVAICLILIGIFLGRIIAFGLKRLAEKIKLEKNIRPSFIKLIIAVIKWAIYIIFIDLALIELPIPQLTELITKVLVVIPALVGSLLLIATGFAIAIYLREVVEDSEITGWRVLSLYLYYFILYVFGVYALKIALISLDEFVSNILIILLTAIIGVSIAYITLKNSKT